MERTFLEICHETDVNAAGAVATRVQNASVPWWSNSGGKPALRRNGVLASLRHQGFAGRIVGKFAGFSSGWILQPFRNCRSLRAFRLTCVPIAFIGPGVFWT
jgi:hypothetical protein